MVKQKNENNTNKTKPFLIFPGHAPTSISTAAQLASTGNQKKMSADKKNF